MIIVSILLLINCNNQNVKEYCEYESPVEVRKPQIVLDVIKIFPDPKISHFWIITPKITFCKSSGISETRAQQAVSYWKKLGYPILEVKFIRNDAECIRDTEYGEIMVKIINSDTPIRNNLAVTSVAYRSDTRVILTASIYMIPGYANKPRVIEHEIGHALGWGHYRRSYHIMNPNYKDTGSNAYGLRYSAYRDLSEKF